MIGETISHYRIVEKLGGGGMGVVYKAEDIYLGRFVALKFLPDNVSQDPQTLERFRREARAASALNHPNVCTIHEIGEHENKRFIAMEFLDGRTLKHLIQSRPLELDTLVSLGIEIADALDAAHSQGIVHRDIKPANIFITKREHAKILDFGLAKVTIPISSAAQMAELSTQTASDLAGEHLTSPGTALGTVAYMSPEQVRATELDARTDLFSFGAVLYEMATGALPFRGESSGLIFEAILNRTPLAPVRINPDVPSELESIISKALEKDRDFRYQAAAEIRADLLRLKRRTETHPSPPVRISNRSKAILGIGGPVFVLLVLAAVFYHWRERSPTAPPLQPVYRQVTFLGNAWLPAISPDGSFIAYVTQRTGGESRLMMQALSGGPSLELFHAKGIENTAWSPDGSEIMVTAWESVWEKQTTFVTSRLGGAPRRVFDGSGQCWTRDASEIVSAGAAPEKDAGKGIRLVDKLTGTEKRINGPGYQFLAEIDCSTKTNMLALLTHTSGKNEIWTMKTDGTEQRKLLEDEKDISSLRWAADGDAIYYLRADGDTMDLVKLPVSEQLKKPSVLVSGLDMGGDFTLSADGSQLAYTREQRYSNLWLAELKGPETGPKVQVKPLTSGTLSYDEPSISPDGAWLAFAVGSATKTNIYKMAIGGGPPVQLTFFDAAVTASPSWSPDGRRLAFVSDQGGTPKVWMVDADGGKMHRLDKTTPDSTNYRLSWSPGSEIVYQQEGLHNLRRMNPETQQDEIVLTNDVQGWIPLKPSPAPDGKKIAIYVNLRTEPGLFVITLDKNSERLVYPGDYLPIGWSPSGSFIYALKGLYGSEIVSIGLDDPKPPRSLMAMPGEVREASVSSDGRKIVANVKDKKSDVWLMKNFDPQTSRAQLQPVP
jgi:serine/threonine protein kinase/Tol biopolymer transport system component